MQPFLDSTDVQRDTDELKQRLARDGYLYLRGFLPNDAVEMVRRRWLQFANQAGWIQESSSGDDLANLSAFCAEPQDEYMAVMHQVYRLPEFWALPLHTKMTGLFERLLGGDVLTLPNVIGRTIFPKRTEYTTPAHQDWVPIQGCRETYTCWLPMSDIPRPLGGLQLNAGSHQGGVYDFKPALGAGATEVTDALDESQWVYSPTCQGDVVIFHSLTVHKGMPNSTQRLRLSIDARYQLASDPVAPNSLQPHGLLISWDELYENWPDQHPDKYYWHKWNLKINQYDTRYVQKRDELAFQMAENGDANARSVLERILSRDSDQSKRERARQLLEKLNQ